jgi:hypothetical protein
VNPVARHNGDAAVGVLRRLFAGLPDLADVGLSVASVSRDREHGDVGGSGIHDEADAEFGTAPWAFCEMMLDHWPLGGLDCAEHVHAQFQPDLPALTAG